MRLYFDLRDKEKTLPDLDGVEVADIIQARRVALEMVRKIHQEDASVAQDWSGWTLDIVDAAGVVLFSIDLEKGA
jgi:hypothetical protein